MFTKASELRGAQLNYMCVGAHVCILGSPLAITIAKAFLRDLLENALRDQCPDHS